MGFVTTQGTDHAKISHPDSPTLEVTVFIQDDGCPVIEIDTTEETGEIRVYVNDGQIFAADPEYSGPRFTLRQDQIHRQIVGIWDNLAGTWYQGAGHEVPYYAGVPMWGNLHDAQIVLDKLNRKA